MLSRRANIYAFPISILLALTVSCAETPQAMDDGLDPVINEAEAEWVRVDLNISTEHPYADNQQENWELEAPEQARGIRLHFNAFETEEDRDYFVLGEDIYHGSLGNFTTKVAPGHLVPVQFSTDDSVTHYGYDIDYYEYLMPSTALGPHGLIPHQRGFDNARDKLQLTLGQHPHNPFDPDAPHKVVRFEEAHYEALVEHALIYRCWRNIPPGITLAQPLTLALGPTLLFPGIAVETAVRGAALAKFIKKGNIAFGAITMQPLQMRMNISQASIQLNVRTATMHNPPEDAVDQNVDQAIKGIQVGFGAWHAAPLNTGESHVASAPTLQTKPINIFKNRTLAASPMKFNWTNKAGASPFRIKAIKI